MTNQVQREPGLRVLEPRQLLPHLRTRAHQPALLRVQVCTDCTLGYCVGPSPPHFPRPNLEPAPNPLASTTNYPPPPPSPPAPSKVGRVPCAPAARGALEARARQVALQRQAQAVQARALLRPRVHLRRPHPLRVGAPDRLRRERPRGDSRHRCGHGHARTPAPSLSRQVVEIGGRSALPL